MIRASLLQAVWRTGRLFPLLILALGLVNLFLYGVHLNGILPSRQSLEQRLSAEKSRLAELRKQQAEGAQTATELERLVRDMRSFEQQVPPRSRFSDLLEELFRLADEAGLHIGQVGFEPEELPRTGYLRYSLNYAVTGEYRQLKKFIHALESSPRLMSLDSIGLRSAGREKGIVLSLKMTTYFRRETS